MKCFDFDATRGGYGLRYYFNAGTDKVTCKTDEEGTDIYDEDTGDYIGNVEGYSPNELVEMSEKKFQQVLEDNYIE
jgi:hypothetical protein